MAYFELACGLITVDAFIRWAQLNKPYFCSKAVVFSWLLDPQISVDVSRWTIEINIVFLRILIGCLREMFAFLGGVMFASYFVLALSDFFRSRRSTSPVEISGARQQFKFSLVPPTIFYSSLTKLFSSCSRYGALPRLNLEVLHTTEILHTKTALLSHVPSRYGMKTN
jgi:hypothetical protein